MRRVVASLLLVLLAGCARKAPLPPKAEMSGFLDDYALLREGGPDELRLVYRKPSADWTKYHKVILDPVTLWRSGGKSLAPVPEEDLLRLVSDFRNAVRTALGERYQFAYH